MGRISFGVKHKHTTPAPSPTFGTFCVDSLRNRRPDATGARFVWSSEVPASNVQRQEQFILPLVFESG